MRIITGKREGEVHRMSRKTPTVGRAIEQHSEAYRMCARVFSRNGVVDAEEQATLDQLERAGGLFQWADWQRRVRYCLEDHGDIPHGHQLRREFRELWDRYGFGPDWPVSLLMFPGSGTADTNVAG